MPGSDLRETVNVNVDMFTNETGTTYTMNGQDLTEDLSDCVNDAQINPLQYCVDQQEIDSTVIKPRVCVDVAYVGSSRSSVGATTCTTSGVSLCVDLFVTQDRSWARL